MTNSDASGAGSQHTLIIVEEDDLDDPALYQVTKVDHPRYSEQAKIVSEAHRRLASEAKKETGVPHRVVVEGHDPETAEKLYEHHQERLEAVA